MTVPRPRASHSVRCGSQLLCLLLVFLLAACVGDPQRDAPRPGYSVDRDLSVTLQGYRRSYRVYIPGSYDPDRAWPVVIAIHGAFSDARYHEQRTGFSLLAEREGFIVIYPNGIGIMGWLQHWNAGHCCGRALDEELDDVGFVFAALDDAAAKLNIDRRRVYVTGFSNGGMLTHRIGAERADAVAAIAPVAGAMGGSETPGGALWRIPDPARPLPVLMVHGDGDDRVPFAGGPRPDRPDSQQYLSAVEGVLHWARVNDCDDVPRRESLYQGRVTRQAWPGCRADTELWTVNGWRHIWPGPQDPTRPADTDLHGLDTAGAIWQFFQQHTLPAQALAVRAPARGCVGADC